ncbi:CatA-like O-acetyltransferase [Pontibacter cellulosilyticus]|uniref:Chloramphenicol acetyltransferase n=1 Tax=Pontibacter cellulosilyticus TaxID=1720253 RepID=A0A923SL75_9BACT|nr:CatA-like O-acetyltransferase [Pontibacter cellulosilyticus]MBC5994571.1 chloramphenicol acetyltransferase [Pontibacter cellulosilyticus]
MHTKTQYSKTSFEIKGWEREEHFHFFRAFTQPFFNVHTEVDITNLYHYAKKEKLSVFLAYLHAATEGVRATENFLLRLEGDEVVKYEAVDISTTVLKDNKTVSFVHLTHHTDLHTFCNEASEIIAEVKKSNRLFYGYNGPDLVHATTLPWFTLKGMEHAHIDQPDDSIPKLAFGKLEFKEDRVILPVSVRVHHALVDGYHIHLFLEHMKASINSLGKI